MEKYRYQLYQRLAHLFEKGAGIDLLNDITREYQHCNEKASNFVRELELPDKEEYENTVIVRSGKGACGTVFMVTNTSQKYGKKITVSVMLKISNMYENGIHEYEVNVGKMISKLCRGNVSNMHQISPHVVRIYGSIRVPVCKTHIISDKTFKNILCMEPIFSPYDVSDVKGLLYEIRNNTHAWDSGWVRKILFQVLFTLAVWGGRYRHNDLTPLNVLLNRTERHVQLNGYGYALELDARCEGEGAESYKKNVLYFKVDNIPFESKIIDFGMAMDLASHNTYEIPNMHDASRRILGIVKIPCIYYDTYSFLHTFYALSGYVSTLDSTDDRGNVVMLPIFQSDDTPVIPADKHPEIAKFVQFMERLGVRTMPRITPEDSAKVTGEKRLIRQWIPEHIQKEAEISNGLVTNASGHIFQFLTPSQILQDSYFDPIRSDAETFRNHDPYMKSFARVGASWDVDVSCSKTGFGGVFHTFI